MVTDVGGDERTLRDHPAPLPPHVLERLLGEHLPKPLPLEVGVDLGVHEDADPVLVAIAGETGQLAVLADLVAIPIRVVSDLRRQAPRPGFEPGAYSLGGSRSIQLSYRGPNPHGSADARSRCGTGARPAARGRGGPRLEAPGFRPRR